MGFFTLTKILEERESPINGKISVIKSLALGTYIQVENLTQSGGVVYEVWKSALRKIRSKKPKLEKVLILGLGGGSAAKIVQKLWPKVDITGVDIDSVMVELGKKYLGLGGVKIIEEDAENYLKNLNLKKKKFDLILVDLYVGDTVPEKFDSPSFIENIKGALFPGGIAVFNRLYYGEKRKVAVKFAVKLEKSFSRVEYFYPEANVMFITS